MSSSQLTSYLTVKTESFSSEIRHKTKLSTLTTFIQLSFGSPVQIHQAMKRKSESKSERKRQNWHYVQIEKWSVSRSVVSDSVTSRTAACQAPLPIGILQARILEWVSVPSSRGSSQPRDWTQVSCIASGFFTIWATREAWQKRINNLYKRELRGAHLQGAHFPRNLMGIVRCDDPAATNSLC